MSIFISYSRQDQAYVNKLVQALEREGLPVWLDDRINYGDKWPRVIEENLRKSQVFLLVMSPRSKNSHWVNCELALALELKKPIFPLLLDGNLWLEVRIIQTVDVQGYRLPPASFFDRVRSELGSEVKVRFSRNGVKLKSEKGINYTKLRDLLAAGKWKEADQETGKVMCQAAGRENEEWLRIEDIDNFPCEDLRTINQLWLHYSSGKFGFSVQKEIYESLGGTREYNKEMWDKFGDRVGWRKGGENWLYYKNLTFNLELAPQAHLPAKVWVRRSLLFSILSLGGDWALWGDVLFSRAKTCQL
jgi:hypothetical protein